MKKLVFLGVLMLLPARAMSQSDGRLDIAQSERLRSILDRCASEGSEDDIVVCGRRDKNLRYRLPPPQDRFDPDSDVESVSRERHRLMEGGEAGINSCSTTGPGGVTGCILKGIERGRQQRGW